MMPAQVMARAVPVFSDAGPEPLHFLDELLSIERGEIIVHTS
jgi:hypothetical protein